MVFKKLATAAVIGGMFVSTAAMAADSVRASDSKVVAGKALGGSARSSLSSSTEDSSLVGGTLIIALIAAAAVIAGVVAATDNGHGGSN